MRKILLVSLIIEKGSLGTNCSYSPTETAKDTSVIKNTIHKSPEKSIPLYNTTSEQFLFIIHFNPC